MLGQLKDNLENIEKVSERLDAKRKILIVEDNTDNAKMLQAILDDLYGENILVKTVNTGREALAVISKEKDLDVVLLDLILPEVPGLEILQVLHKECPRAQVVAISGSTMLLEEALKLGAITAIPKPYRMQDIDKVLTRICSSR